MALSWAPMPALSVLTQISFILAMKGCPVEIAGVQTQGYDKATARKIARVHREELCRCVITPPKVGGETILIEYVITSSGEVGRARVQDTTAAEMTAQCMARVVETWRFPNGPCGVAIVQQRFNLV